MLFSGAVYEVLRVMDYPDQVPPNAIHCLIKNQKLAGEICTIQGKKVNGIDAHETLLKSCSMLSVVPAGIILICQPNDDTLAWIPSGLGGEIQIGNVNINKRDHLIADSDGIVIIPESIVMMLWLLPRTMKSRVTVLLQIAN
jgi:regulator of RNase E activity RraA